MSTKNLNDLLDQILTSPELLPAGVRESIDSALAQGMPRREILRIARRQAGGRRGLALSVEAYLGCDQDGNPK